MSHETIYRSLFIQVRGVLKKELMGPLRSGWRLRRAITSLQVLNRELYAVDGHEPRGTEFRRPSAGSQKAKITWLSPMPARVWR